MSELRPISIFSFAARLTVGFYILSLLIALPYFNWRYAREHSFSDWLAWGEITPTARALVWPYFWLHRPVEASAPQPSLSQRQTNEMQIMSAMRAIDAALQANYIIDSRKPGEALTKEQVQEAIRYASQSLHSADTTDQAALNELFPEFGTHFKTEFCEGQRLLIMGLKENSRSELERSSELDRVWKDWYNANRKSIENAFNEALGR